MRAVLFVTLINCYFHVKSDSVSSKVNCVPGLELFGKSPDFFKALIMICIYCIDKSFVLFTSRSHHLKLPRLERSRIEVAANVVLLVFLSTNIFSTNI